MSAHPTEVRVRALTARDLRERLADLPDATEIHVETIVGGDLITDDTALIDARCVTTADGYYLRLLLDPADPYGTRDLIDDGLAARESVTAILDDHGDCIEGANIHTWDGDECADDCPGCCADEVIRRVRDLAVTFVRTTPTRHDTPPAPGEDDAA